MVSMESRVAALVNDFTPALGKFERTASRHLAQFFGCDSAWFATFGPSFTDGLPPFFRSIVADPQRYDRDQARTRQIVSQFGTTFIDTEAYTAKERDRLPIYSELIRPANISSVLVSHVEVAGTATGIVNLVRSGAPFEQSAIEEARPLLRTVSILHRAIVGGPMPTAEDALARLSPREHEVAVLAGDAYGAVQIAARLGTSVHTVRRQLESIYRKCGIGSRVELAGLVQRSKLRAPRPGPQSPLSSNVMRILHSARLVPSVRTEDWQCLG